MNQSDRIKVCNAGFTVIRHAEIKLGRYLRKKYYEIWAIDKDHSSWFNLAGPFTSMKAKTKKMKELLKDPMIIED